MGWEINTLLIVVITFVVGSIIVVGLIMYFVTNKIPSGDGEKSGMEEMMEKVKRKLVTTLSFPATKIL